MPAVLTRANTVNCDQASPALHGGTLSISSTAKLTVKKSLVFRKSDVLAASIAGCGTPTASNPPTKPCGPTSGSPDVKAVTKGESTTLQAGGEFVILATLKGTTNGKPPGTLYVATPKDVLTAL
jgi:hypothetical protein